MWEFMKTEIVWRVSILSMNENVINRSEWGMQALEEVVIIIYCYIFSLLKKKYVVYNIILLLRFLGCRM